MKPSYAFAILALFLAAGCISLAPNPIVACDPDAAGSPMECPSSELSDAGADTE